jgi:peptide-methionine (S)-S-oxide reductase
VNRQGNDVGTQYRSVIFVTTPEQMKTAKDFINEINASNPNGKPIVTDVEMLAPEGSPAGFYVAENYHQDYFNQNRGQPYCEVIINPKLEKVVKQFGDLVTESAKQSIAA